MRSLSRLKARFPRLFPVVTLALAVGSVAGVALVERNANAGDTCCYPGAPCCHPGAACCKGHEHASK